MRNTIGSFVLALVAVTCLAATSAQADFTLIGSQHLDVTSSHNNGILYDTSTAEITGSGAISYAYVNDQAALTVNRTSGTGVTYAYAYNQSQLLLKSGRVYYVHGYGDSATVMDGGEIYYSLSFYEDSTFSIISGNASANGQLRNNSSANVAGGAIQLIYTYDNSSLTMTGGFMSSLVMYHNGNALISGGSLGAISASNTSVATIVGKDFRVTGGLSLVEFDNINGVPQYEVVGTGILNGTWAGSDEIWTTYINSNATTAKIYAVPEPATMSLIGLGLGGLIIRRRRLKLAAHCAAA